MNKKGFLFKKIILDIVLNCCDDTYFSWMNTKIENLISSNKYFMEKYLCSGRNTEIYERIETASK